MSPTDTIVCFAIDDAGACSIYEARVEHPFGLKERLDAQRRVIHTAIHCTNRALVNIGFSKPAPELIRHLERTGDM